MVDIADSWTTRDGRVLKISDMETSHLKNTITWIAKNARNIMCREYLANQFACARAMVFVQGEMAQDALESEMNREFAPDREDIAAWIEEYPVRKAMLVELHNREKIDENTAKQ